MGRAGAPVIPPMQSEAKRAHRQGRRMAALGLGCVLSAPGSDQEE